MPSRRLPASLCDISVPWARGEPEPETVNHRTKLTPSPLGSRDCKPRRTKRFMDPSRRSLPRPFPRSSTPSHCYPSKIYFREESIDFFINNSPPGRPRRSVNLSICSHSHRLPPFCPFGSFNSAAKRT